MIPVKSALNHGKTLLASRIPVGKIYAKIPCRNKTSILWNRRFSNGSAIFKQQQKLQNFVKNSNNATNDERPVSSTVMKIMILTSVTIALGTIFASLGTQKLDHDEDANDAIDGKSTSNSRKIKISNNNWFLFCYSTLPLNAVSRLWGQFNNLTLPIWFRPWGYRFYSYLFGVELDEMVDADLTHYTNLSNFFYRGIKPEARPIEQGQDVIVCPSDGKVLQLGIINSETGEIEQVKGMTYSIKEFLGTHSHPLMSKSESSLDLNLDFAKHKEFAKANDIETIGSGNNTDIDNSLEFKSEGDKASDDSKPSVTKTMKLLSELSLHYPSYSLSSKEPKDTELYFAVIYLAPGDYHHYHSPIDWVCKVRRHFPGALFSVAPYFQRNFPNLFVLNERVALLGHWKHGFFSMTPVGATNVGSIVLNFDKELVTNTKSHKHVQPKTCYEATYRNSSKILGGVPLIKGEDMGGFQLGSTVVLCFEAPRSFEYKINVGDKVKMGQELGRVE
ncbi:hypothetical protein Kpol_1051p29 [Vanderwaltozyma polyspora DSM 70294]|uniref:Phosphatidylserine decarboxylase proenzyme 1, mitochondrial n=1 Tax=Vanderwaltozyma polyspora (strain ATCC 22028 / DSM 70294 / BCRC 21397 / CBS 2163 / NBRC 10782 / NRRL Y-8283 / UCD 57-17) TaxID=436907 RepID=A7TMZ2_VANPO|nr:uncharacterized protein Kpol_1051p29 [Vanderwaltozyma polyspora DSM 70294]EDO16380.1 hypothetical protein Kpol_1051p29 [Vanderwaltozyma polyspora DSM 70294]